MSSYTAATNGVAGNITDFPNIFSGAGTRGDSGTAGAGASGGGASGGGGSYGGGDHSTADSGGGGGGAGGSPDAGGGTGGRELYFPGKDASNPHTTPTMSTNYLGSPSNLGRGGVGQTSSQAATNGYNGWFYIYRFEQASDNNLGPILITTPSDIADDGEITGNVTESVDNGLITDTATENVDDGTIFFAPAVTILNLGSVADPTTENINNGGI